MATVVSTSASQYKGKEVKTLSDGSKVRVDSKTGKSGSGSKNSIDTTTQKGLDAFAAENSSAVNPAINSTTLAPTPELKLPTPTPINATGALASATTTVKAPSIYDQTAQSESDQYNYQGIIDAINKYDKEAPPSSAAIFAEQEKRDGIQQKQQLVNDYTAQLNAIAAKAQADKLRVEGQGRGIPEVIIGGQQAQIEKEAAIESLPVAAQLAAAQGNLATAQQHVDTYAKLLIADANAKYQHKQDIFKTILPFLDAAEKRRLDVLDQKNAQTRADAVSLAQAKANALTTAFQSGAPGAVIKAISSATDIEAIAMALGPSLRPTGGGAAAPTIKTINGVDYQWNPATGKWEDVQISGAGGGAQAQKTAEQLSFLRNTVKTATGLAGASGASGVSKFLGDTFVGDSKFRQLEAQTNTLRVNVLALMTDPTIKKFFGPQMSNADVTLMTSAGTTLNPNNQTSAQMKTELTRLDDLLKRMQSAVQTGVDAGSGGYIITGPNGEQIEIID